jgi:hypothetical protein
MMPIGSTQGKNDVLDADYGASRSTAFPATVYLGLFNGDPSVSGSELDTSTGGYARLAIPNDSSNWGVASGGVKTNLLTLYMSASTGAFNVPADYFGFFDASVGGNLLDTGQLLDISNNPTTITVSQAGVVLQFAAGSIQITT